MKKQYKEKFIEKIRLFQSETFNIQCFHEAFSLLKKEVESNLKTINSDYKKYIFIRELLYDFTELFEHQKMMFFDIFPEDKEVLRFSSKKK